MNCCALDFPDATFDAVVDKGTMDSVLCGEGSTANVAKMCSEMSRCVRSCGFARVALSGRVMASLWRHHPFFPFLFARLHPMLKPPRPPPLLYRTFQIPSLCSSVLPTACCASTPLGSVLKPDGVFFIVSYGTPENRMSYLENDEYKWRVTVHTVGTCDLRAGRRQVGSGAVSCCGCLDLLFDCVVGLCSQAHRVCHRHRGVQGRQRRALCVCVPKGGVMAARFSFLRGFDCCRMCIAVLCFFPRCQSLAYAAWCC